MLGNAAADGREVSLSQVRDGGRDGITGSRNKGDIGFVSVRGGPAQSLCSPDGEPLHRLHQRV